MANFYFSFRKWQKQKETKKMTTKQQQTKKRTTKTILHTTKNARKRIYTYTRKYKIITNFNSKPLLGILRHFYQQSEHLYHHNKNIALNRKFQRKHERRNSNKRDFFFFKFFLFRNFVF